MRHVALYFVGMLFGTFIAVAAEPRPAGNIYRISVYRVHDADTISDCNISLGFNVVLMHQSIRLMGFDAPEVSRTRQGVTITDEEIAVGKEARDALKQLLLDGEAYVVPAPNYRDPRGRQGGYLWVYKDDRWIEIAEWAKERGYTRGDE